MLENKSIHRRLLYLERFVRNASSQEDYEITPHEAYTLEPFKSVPIPTLLNLTSEQLERTQTSLERRAKRILETALGDRVMLPHFGSKLYTLVDKKISEEYRVLFIAYSFAAFWDEESKKLWDPELEPEQIVLNDINDTTLEAEIRLTSGEILNA